MPDLTPITKMVAFMLAKGAKHEEIIEMVSSMETSMDILRGESKEISVEKDRAYNRQEERKALDRKRKRLSYTAKQSKKTSVELSTETTKEHIYVEEKDVKPMYVKEMEVKEEATNVEVKEEKVKHNSIKDTELSRTRTRARKKTGTEIPIDLLCSEKNISDAIKIGLVQGNIATEWAKFNDYHRHKGTLGLDWEAGWRTWCRNHMTWNGKQNNQSAKPLSPRLQVILNNRRIFDELASRAAETNHCPEKELRPLGSPAPEIVSPNRNSGYGGIRSGYGPNHGTIPRKSDS